MRNNAVEKLLSTARSEGFSITEDAFAECMDNVDALREYRDSYHLPRRPNGKDIVYLCNNALGLQHKDVETSLNEMMKKWREQGVNGYTQQPRPWSEVENICRKHMASVVGARESEVALMNDLTVNIHLLMTAFYKPHGHRRKILTENQPFPCCAHALMSQLEVHGLKPADDLIFVNPPSKDLWESGSLAMKTEQFLSIIEKCGEEIAIIMISAVHFITGHFFDIETITKAAHGKGIIVGIDCANAAGNVPLSLHDWGVDFACWCTYKYLNGGPGNVSASFVHSKHTAPDSKYKWLRGWWGHERLDTIISRPKSFSTEENMLVRQISGPPVIGILTLVPSLRLMSEIGMSDLRDKSMLLTAYAELLLNELVPSGFIEVITPADPKQRGAQISFRIKERILVVKSTIVEVYDSSPPDESDAEKVQRLLACKGIAVESYPPDVIQIAPVPLYNSFIDVLLAVREIAGCLLT